MVYYHDKQCLAQTGLERHSKQAKSIFVGESMHFTRWSMEALSSTLQVHLAYELANPIDKHRLPLPDSTFDAVCEDHVLQHLADPVAVVRVLRAAGIIITLCCSTLILRRYGDFCPQRLE